MLKNSVFTAGAEGPDRVIYEFTVGSTSATFIGLATQTGASAATKLVMCQAAGAPVVASSVVKTGPSATATGPATPSSTEEVTYKV